MAIITAAEYKTYRNITTADYDTRITNAIARVQAQVEKFCGRKFDAATYTEKSDGDGTEIVTLYNAPIRTLTSVTITDDGGNTTVYSASTSPTAAETFRVEINTGILAWIGARTGLLTTDKFGVLERSRFGVSPRFPRGFQNITVVYDGGYVDADATYDYPADLQLAMLEAVDDLLVLTLDGSGSTRHLKSESIGGYSYTKESLADLIGLLAHRFGPYRVKEQ